MRRRHAVFLLCAGTDTVWPQGKYLSSCSRRCPNWQGTALPDNKECSGRGCPGLAFADSLRTIMVRKGLV